MSFDRIQIVLLQSLLFLLIHCDATKLIHNSTEIETITRVRTNSGPVSGLFTVRLGVNVSCYLGIPYAEPPLGERRFADPIPARPWNKTYQALRQPPICYQREWRRGSTPESFWFARELARQDPEIYKYYESTKSEDCLYLSVFRAAASNNDNSRNKTVLVWLHPGAFITGTANLPHNDYPFMVARDPNLILVAVNYRLNVFGFITSGTDELSGNYGLKDQIMALRWVRNNIDAFGGNASRVVLWGQSAGAVGIGYHMMMKKSGGEELFHRVILESGNPLLPLTIGPASYRQRAFNEYVRLLNCNRPNETNQEILQCLRSKSSDQLFEPYHRSIAKYFPLAFQPNPHDRSLFEYQSLWQAIRAGRFWFSGDILMGTNEAEGAQYVKMGPLDQFYSNEQISPNFTRPNIMETLVHFVPNSMRSMIEPVFDLIMDGVNETTDATELWQHYVKLVGDMVFVCPDYFFIKAYLESRKTNHGKVYYYRFKSRVSRPFDCPKWSRGACHTDELQFAFGNPLQLPDLFPKEEIQLTKAIMSSWFDFAHHGQFNSPESFTNWTQFNVDKPSYLQIETTKYQMVFGFPGDRCRQLCEPLYDVLESLDDASMKLIMTKK